MRDSGRSWKMDWYVLPTILLSILIPLGLIELLRYKANKDTLSSLNQQNSEFQKTLIHLSNLLSSKDPMAFQAVSVVSPQMPAYDSEYDPSDEAEIARLRERGISDGAILDEWSGDEGREFATIRSELYGDQST
jgi:hypothetical protein